MPQRRVADVQRDPPLAIGELPARLYGSGSQHAGAQRAREIILGGELREEVRRLREAYRAD